MKIKNILEGWENFIIKSEVSEALATERAVICAGCPNAKRTKLLAFLNDEVKEIKGAYCYICKCPLSSKIRSKNEKCPLQKW